MSVSADRKPRLWIERLLITQSIDPLEVVRDITLRPGLNLVWAKEPEDAINLTSPQRAGHGVGKSTFTLMLRCLLGDDGKAVKGLRQQLAGQFPHGGIGAVVHIGDATYSVYRPYAADGFAAEHRDLNALVSGGERFVFKAYLDALSGFMLANLQQREIPGTNQTIEWPHVLSWVTRDQGTRLRSYYDWRSADGAGLQRSRQDPPWLLRAVLGVTDIQEADAVGALDDATRRLEQAKTELKDLEHSPRQIRARIEANLRRWVGADSTLQFQTDDLFQSSVHGEIETKEEQVKTVVARLDEQLEALELEIRQQANASEAAQQQCAVAVAEFDVAQAMCNRDEEELKRLHGRMAELGALVGHCGHGGVLFQKCTYIQQRIAIPQISDGRDKKMLEKEAAVWAEKATNLLPIKTASEQRLREAKGALESSEGQQRKLRIQRDTGLVELSRAKLLREELASWEDASGAATSHEMNAKRAEVLSLEQRSGSSQARIANARAPQSDRTDEISKQMDRLAQAFELQGQFLPYDDERPFGLVGSAGEAYSVLEILLGDFVCAVDSIDNPKSSFPGFLIHDCPREADLSDFLYGEYLSLLAGEERSSPGWQAIVTTTTPPPVSLRTHPYLVLELGPAHDDDLLLRTRFGLH